MTSLLFGDSGSPLFGVFHAAQAGKERHHAVLICPPIGHEYMRSHVAISGLAKRLAAAGFATFKFDYYGSGDSAGATEEGNRERWQDSIRLAADELAEISGGAAMSIVGLRFGASLAATLKIDRAPIDAFVGWDPVINGTTYLAELQAMHDRILSGTRRFREPRHRRQDDDELLGFRFPPPMRESIAGLDLIKASRIVADRCLLVSSQETVDLAPLGAALETAGVAACAVETIPDAGEWGRLHDIHDAMLASVIPGRIVEFLAADAT